MFKKIISKQCVKPGCKSYGVIVDTSPHLCEDCGEELRANTVIDQRKLIPALALACLLITGACYVGVIGVKR